MSDSDQTRFPPGGPADRVYSVASVRELDRATIEGGTISGYDLMTRAATAALDSTLEHFPAARRMQVLCGGGNNAGDGFVLARLAVHRGVDVDVLSLLDPGSLRGDAATALSALADAGVAVSPWAGSLDPDADVLVDALLGSGLDRPVDGDFRQAVEALNRHASPVVALDIPTGLHGDSGRVMGAAVDARLTVTFVGLKTGLYVGAGPDHCGTIVFDGLGIPDAVRRRIRESFRRLPEGALAAVLPPRQADAHKGRFGHVLIVGGGPGMPGAVRLAGAAALRAGAGLVTIATHPAHAAMVTADRPELMATGVSTAADLAGLLAQADVIALGPGLGQSEWSRQLFDAAVHSGRALVVDADALNVLAKHPVKLGDAVVTPHPGEAARLLGVSTADVQADRPGSLARLVDRYADTVVLKGAGTLVSSREGTPWLCTRGNPGMASPGMGDALTGIIAGLRAQGLSAEEAGIAGVEVHARAGDRAARQGERGLLAGDLIDRIRGCVNP